MGGTMKADIAALLSIPVKRKRTNIRKEVRKQVEAGIADARKAGVIIPDTYIVITIRKEV
jgi:hypothetical protein